MEKEKGTGSASPLLELHFREVHAAPVDPGRGAGLEAAQGEAQPLQALGQRSGGLEPVGPRSCGPPLPQWCGPQIGAGGDDAGAHPEHRPGGGDHSGDRPVLGQDVHHLGLAQEQVFLGLQGCAS